MTLQQERLKVVQCSFGVSLSSVTPLLTINNDKKRALFNLYTVSYFLIALKHILDLGDDLC